MGVEGEAIYGEVPGGPELLSWFGRVPSFHDAEILSLHLNRRGQSSLKLYGWNTTGQVDARGFFMHEKHATVTFTIDGIMDLQIDGFSIPNVIGGLILRRAPDRLERRGFLLDPHPNDIEIELEPCYGLDGFIRARAVTITFQPGKQDDRDV